MRFSRLAIAALALPLLAACKDFVSNETIGTRPEPSGGSMFANYIALGTSISAGVQSGGINDSTQKQAFPYLLASAMGLHPGVDWFYPSFPFPGCTPPYSNPLTNTYVGGTASTCTLINPAYTRPYQNNLGVPSIRVAQVLKITDLSYPATDTLKAATFITGGRNPIDIVRDVAPTFVTLEIGANDVLGAATRGDTLLLTPLATFQAKWTAIADTIQQTGANVAVANVPNVDNIPHFSAGLVFFCLKTGACPGVPATAPYNLATFTVNASCAPTSSGGVGDQMLVGFKATATITGVLAQGGAASLNCGTASATVTTLAGTAPVGPVLSTKTTLAFATQVVQVDSFIHLQAIARGWAYVDLNGGLTAAKAAGQVPPFPAFSTPSALFGPIFSLDGIHPNKAGHKIIADAFVAAINAKYGTTLTAP